MSGKFLKAILPMVLMCGLSAAQVTIAKPPAPTVTPAGPHRQEPPGGQRPPNNAGDVEGFVYWDASAITQKNPGTCAGLAVVVSAAGSQNNTIQLGNNFKYAGQVKAYLYGGKIMVYDVCIYAYHGQPVGPQLQAQLVITQPNQFSPNVAPQVATISPITIINAQCNMLPPVVPSTVGDLTSHWGSCQNRAYDVNFALVASTHMLGTSEGTRGTLLNANNGAVSPGPINSPSHGTLMGGTNPGPQNSPSQGMLTGGTNPGPQQTSTHATATGATNPGPINSPSRGTVPGASNPGPQNASRGMLVPAVKPAQTQTSSAKGTPGQLLPYRPGAPTLTNSDVVGLVKGGVPESAIVNQIKSSNGQFDLSPQGCSALAQAHVSANVLNAMANGSSSPCFTGGVRTGKGNGADDLNPQPYPPKGTGETRNSAPGLTQQTQATLKKAISPAALKPINLPPPNALRKVTNPRLAQQNASIIAVLDQQSLAAQQDSAAMKLALQPAATARTTALATNFQGNVPAPGVAPSQTQSAPGNSLSSLARLQPFNSVVLACSMDATPRIFRVNDGQAPGIFTPEAKYNQYTIVGCSFGQAQGTAHVYGQNGFSANLNIDYWSNNGITAHLDPSLAGVLDQNNITLVVVPPGQQQIQKSGYKFYAARGMPLPDGTDQEVQLAYDSMSQSNVALYDSNPVLTGWDGVPQNGGSKFPSFSFQGTPVAGWVFRYAYGHSDQGSDLNMETTNWSCFINDVAYSETSTSNPCASYFNRWQTFGADTWDFGKLSSGFTISSYELYYENLDAQNQLCCSWDATKHACSAPGNWNFNLTTSGQITVAWPVYWCWDTEATPFDRLNQQEQSAYGLAVWVLGPRCIDPWTGQKDQSCMAKVKQILG